MISHGLDEGDLYKMQLDGMKLVLAFLVWRNKAKTDWL